MLVRLIQYFGWTWVGFITLDDISGFYEHQTFSQYLSSQGICMEFAIYLNFNVFNDDFIPRYRKTIADSSSSVIIFGGTVSIAILSKITAVPDVLANKNLIFSPQWETYLLLHFDSTALINNSLIFSSLYPYNLDTPEINYYYEHLHPLKYPEVTFLEDIWFVVFYCFSGDLNKKNTFEFWYDCTLPKCTGEERITNHQTFKFYRNSPRVHFPVTMMVRAIEALHVAHNQEPPEKPIRPIIYRHQLQHYLKKMPLYMEYGQFYEFDEYGNLEIDYGIFNSIIAPRTETNEVEVTLRPVGKIRPRAPSDQQLEMNKDLIMWNSDGLEIPRSQCSDNCLPGFRKATKETIQSCCFRCVPCAEGEISNTTDSELCFPCNDTEWPNKKRTQCIAKAEAFLSYRDVISMFFSAFSVLSFFITLLILGVFISYRDSPIVRANNRSLSFLLLVSIKLSFLSVFLFLGRPVDITCMLRIITFGITFSIAVSSLLAKTIMVCVAFKATKPGSSWRKWLGVKLSNSVVLFCSSIQIIICMTWLAISPPFQELDIHTSPGTIIIQCNEGSAIGFYSVIGYMGLLAAVSFVLAFLARSLPDSFNEAKYITFSMLLFCSVWITMIPAYLSTKGKNTVCVEIFAILTSSAGLLACIFLPKCYIIMFKPAMNTKKNVL
uniref:G-protein coupled receptors family 3 profile domain-containing protein n=1 Tax=Xenopus tropicalis TaxID=8364 RepID=A0A803KD19_XENTR